MKHRILTRCRPLPALAVILAVTAPTLSWASTDPMIEGARQCTQHFPGEEQRNGIPAHLLAAISSAESGRWHNGLGLALPWPWTINVEGKGYYFNSKAEAIAQTNALLKRGARSIDVGCMQVNIKHHAGAFANLDDAFEPSKNVAYGAKFLRSNYDTLGDWVKATAAYHSRTPVYGQQYLGKIEKSWNRIVSKVQQARAVQGQTVEVVAAPKFSNTKLTPTKPQPVKVANNGLVPVKTTAPTPYVVKANAPAPMREARRERLIQVSEQPSPRPAQTLIISGAAPTASKNTATKIADARDAANDLLVRGASDTVRRVHILGDQGVTVETPVTAVSGTAAGAHFVFAN